MVVWHVWIWGYGGLALRSRYDESAQSPTILHYPPV